MRIIAISLLLSIFVFDNINAQEPGIKFDSIQTWEKIILKAKAENKYILIDCFATWCGPCKAMEMNVYNREDVGTFANPRFISVKLQMDSTSNDDKIIIQLRSFARKISQDYNIISLPSFLIFSPDGIPVHKGIGYYEPKEFISFLFDGLDSSKQFYTKIDQFESSKLCINEYPELAIQAKQLGYKEKSTKIALKFKTNFLDTLDNKLIYQNNIISFINNNWDLFSSKDSFFYICYNNPESVDSIVPNTSKLFVDYIISREEIHGKIYSKGTPVIKYHNWDLIKREIANKYKKIDANKLVLNEQINFYKRSENWEKYVFFREKKIREQPPTAGGGFSGDAWNLNSDAWDIFLKCTNMKILLSALNWIDLSIKLAEEGSDNVLFAYYDTKASILYKIGRKKEAITLEQKAISIAKSKGENYDDYIKAIEKMQKGEPIYDAEWKYK